MAESRHRPRGEITAVVGPDGKPVEVFVVNEPTVDKVVVTEPVPVYLHGHPTNHPLPVHGNVAILGQPVQTSDALGPYPSVVFVADTGVEGLALPVAEPDFIDVLSEEFTSHVYLLSMNMHVRGFAYYQILHGTHVWRSGFTEGRRDIPLTTRDRVMGKVTLRMRAIEKDAHVWASFAWQG